MSVWGKLEKRIRKLVKKKKDDEKRGSGGSGSKPAAKANPPAAKVKVETKASTPAREDYTPRGTGSNVIDAVGRKIYSPTLRGTGFSTTTPGSRLKTVDTKLMDMASSRKADTAVKKADIELKSLTDTLKKRSDNALKDPKEARRLSQDRDASTLTAGTAKGKNLTDSVNAAGKLKNTDTIKAELKQKSRATKRREWREATGHRYDVNEKGISDEEKQKRRQNVKMRPYSADTAVAEAEHAMKYNREGESFARGALSGATFGASDLIAKKGTKGEARKAEEVYQEKKSKGAEIAGEVVGSLASFGTTAAATDKVAAKVGGKAMERAAEKLAGRKVIQKSATKAAEKLVAKGGAKEVTAELIKEIGQDKAKRVVTALGNDIVQNLTTGALMDINRASTQHEVGSKEWWGEIGRSAAFNAAITTGIGGVALATGSRRVAKEAAQRLKARSNAPDAVLDRLASNAARRAGDIETPRADIRDMARGRAAADEITEDAVKNLGSEQGLTTTANAERRGAGERTEFHRADGETAREQARNRRTAGNNNTATQETFDRDFEAFTRKASETRAKIDELKDRLRGAASEEERAAISQQISDLNSEINREYRAASLRYHPDRGGSDEWMREFNNVYDEYKRGSIKSRSFRSAQSSTRARTTASGGNGGNTPPPRRGATASGGSTGNSGLRRPQGQAKKGGTTSRVVNTPEDIVHRTKQKPTLKERVNKTLDKVERELFDSLTPFEREARRKAKTDPDAMQKDYGAIDALRRFRAKAGQSISRKQINWMEDEVGKSLDEIYAGMDDATETAFDTYLLLKHAPDRLNEGTPIFENIRLATGESLDDPVVCAREADRILREHPEFAEKAEDVYKYTRNELQNRVDAGLLSQETADDWIARHPFYVPTHRDGFSEVSGMKGRTVGAEGEKAAKGSDLDIRSIREQLAEATNRNWRDMTMNNLFRRMFGDRIGAELAAQPDSGLQMVLGNTITLKKSADGGKYYARIWDNGDFKNVEIEKDFYDGLADLYKNGRLGIGLIDGATDAVSGFTSVWKNLITEWSPIFMVKNAMRDFPEAVINSRNRKEFLHNIVPAIKDMASKGQYSQALQRAGVSQSTIIGFDKDVKALSNRKWLSRANQATEMFPRLVEYMATLEKAGVDLNDPNALKSVSKELRDQAAANAADVTVNFQRNGSVGKALNRGLVPFLNPSLQGASKFVRNFAEAEDAKAVLKLCLIGTSLGAAPSVVSQFVNRENPNYQRISARDRANNYIIAYPFGDRETDTFIKIPKSRFAVVYGLPTANVASDNKMQFAEFIKVGKDAIGIVDPSTNYIGSAVATAMATPEGKTWYGSPIVPEALMGVAPSEQYDANTSYVGRALGKATEDLPESLQISPKKADYVIDATTGIVGDVVLPALTPSRQGGGDGASKVLPPVANIPKRAFTIDTANQTDISSRFYNQMEIAEHKKNSYRATDADAEEYERMSAYSKEAAKINQAIKELQGGNKKTKQLDIRELQKVRNQLMQDGLDGKDAPSKQKTMDAVQRSVGTTYAVNNLGKSADQEAMRWYGLKKYGDLSDEEMQKKIDADKGFYKGVKSIGNLDSKVKKATGKSGTTTLGKAVALVDAGADDDLLGAYGCTKQGRNETASKADRAKSYLSNGGSVNEYVKLENARKNLGKLKSYDQSKETAALEKQIANGEISLADARKKQDEIEYNANISYVGLATSLASANSPGRGYELYDIKAKNVQKGINLAAMGFTARDYRKMVKELDADGNGYAKASEIRDYVAKSDFEDKATLYDALYSYKGKYNPFGTPTNYTRAQAANAGKAKGVKWIVNDMDEINVKDSDSSSGGSGYYRRGYYRRGYRRWGSGGSGGSGSGKVSMAKTKVPAIKTNISGGSVNHSNVNVNATIKAKSMASKNNSGGSRVAVKLEPPMLKVEKAKLKKYEV